MEIVEKTTKKIQFSEKELTKLHLRVDGKYDEDLKTIYSLLKGFSPHPIDIDTVIKLTKTNIWRIKKVNSYLAANEKLLENLEKIKDDWKLETSNATKVNLEVKA